MMAREYRAGSKGRYRLGVIRIGIGIFDGDGRGIVENIRLIPVRYGDASQAGGVVEIGYGADGSGNGGRGALRASVVLRVSI